MRHDAADYYSYPGAPWPSGLYNTGLSSAEKPLIIIPYRKMKACLTLTGTNGQLPRRALQSTVLDTVMKTTSASIAVRNLCAPTLPCYPPPRTVFTGGC
ncbi:hypothetical protein BANRA_00028 [Klebsiella pneumoniae]|nr:hypothetical protein BANRA_00028 [Klebsiella pneumoniae]